MQHKEVIGNDEIWLVKAALMTLFVMLLCFVSAFKTWQNETTRARVREHSQQLEAVTLLDREITKCVDLACKAGISQTEFEAFVGPLEPVHTGIISSTISQPGEVIRLYYRRDTRRGYSLKFHDDRLRDFGADRFRYLGDRVPEPESRHYLIGETVRVWVLTIAALAWFVIVLVTLTRRVRRKVVFNTLLALALVCLLAWLLAPSYSVRLNGIMSNLGLAWGALMLAVSLACGHLFISSTAEELT